MTNKEWLNVIEAEAQAMEHTSVGCPECEADGRSACTWCRPIRDLASAVVSHVRLIRAKGRPEEESDL